MGCYTWLILREHIWTIKITQSMFAAPSKVVLCSLYKLLFMYNTFFALQRLPNYVITHVNAYGQHMMILRKIGPPLRGMFSSLTLELATDT